MLDDQNLWWPLHASRPAPRDDVPVELSLKLAAIHAPLAMASAAALLVFEHASARAHFARALPAFGFVLLALIVALRLAIAHAWNARARRLRAER